MNLRKKSYVKAKLYIGCHTANDGTPEHQAEVVLEVGDYGEATRLLRTLENTARGLLNRDGELIKNMMEDGIIKLRR